MEPMIVRPPEKARYSLARQEAETLLDRLAYDAPPISPLDIAASFGLTISLVSMPDEYSDVAGFLDEAQKIIFINKDETFTRQMFTVAHELGHFLLHKDIIQSNPDEYKILYRNAALQDGSVLEQEANCFAANLLVPSNMLKKYQEFPNTTLATLFQVSPEVIGFRKKDLQWQQKLRGR